MDIIINHVNEDSRIIFIHDTNPQGVVSALNLGLSMCQAKYIARMDSDDIACPNRLELQVNFLDKNLEIGVVGSWVKTFGRINETWTMPEFDNQIKVQGLFASMILNPTSMFRRSLMLEPYKLSYDINFEFGAEDFHFWHQLSQRTKFHNIQQSLLFYRLHYKNLTYVKHEDIRKNTRVTLEDRIRNLVPDVSLDELKLHFSIAENEYPEPIEVAQWFKRVRLSNSKTLKYDETELTQELEYRLNEIISRKNYFQIYRVSTIRKNVLRIAMRIYKLFPRLGFKLREILRENNDK